MTSPIRKLARSDHQKRERRNAEMAAKATVISELVFEKAPPSTKHLARRIAICANFVLLCEKHGCPDTERALKMVVAGAATYDADKDGKSDWMRWVGDVETQRREEGKAIVIPRIDAKAAEGLKEQGSG